MNEKVAGIGIIVFFGLAIYGASVWATGFATFSADVKFEDSTIDSVKVVRGDDACSVEDPVFEASVGNDRKVTIKAQGMRLKYKLCLYRNTKLQDSYKFTAAEYQLPGGGNTIFRYSTEVNSGNRSAQIQNVGIVW